MSPVKIAIRSFGIALLAALVFAAAGPAAGAVAAGPTRAFTSPSLGLTVVATDVELPAGDWMISGVAPADVLDQAFLVPQGGEEATAAGRRVQTSAIEKRIESSRWRVQGFFPACRDYAASHGGVGPSALSDLDQKKFAYLLQMIGRSPWPEDADKTVAGPFYFLVPAVPIPRAAPRPPAGPKTPLVLELRPYVDDGKHWVLFSDGSVERLPIDGALVSQYNLTLSSVQPKRQEARKPVAGGTARHTVLALLRNRVAPAVVLTLTDSASRQRLDVRWDLARPQPGSAETLGEWAQARAREWAPLVVQGESAVLRAWAARTRDLYGTTAPAAADLRAARGMVRTTDAMSVLGGRAALLETLQTELLRSAGAPAQEPATIPLSTLKGVEVKSLPFDAMLAGRDGGRIALANHSPVDRLFVYFAKPSALFPFLDHGAEFLFKAGSLVTGSAVDDDLKGRYLRRLGLAEDFGRKFLESGEVTDVAVVTPDLFFLDGTEVTVLMRLRAPDRIVPRLKNLGLVDLTAGAITEKPLPSGRSAFWARHGDLLYLSTSRAELEGVLALAASQGEGSLGRSAELRYMLAQLPLKRESRALIYLSDPFIRRMVGPAVKIAQVRRMRARAEMEMITAGALLFALDGNKDKPDLGRLMTLGYVPRALAAGGYRLRDDLSAVSPVWGSPAEMAAIDTKALDKVTSSEAQAYATYVGEYSRYWRQYFDPIAMRLDDAPGGALELSTVILPLPDSQIYTQLRDVIVASEGRSVLRVPVVTPEPVFLLSLNLTEESWVKISGSWSQLFSQYTSISPAIFDRLGPGLHIAIQDADPLIALGNADLLGAFGGQIFMAGLPREGLMFPFLLSVLTRPCKIFVELQDPQATLGLLRKTSRGARESRREVAVEFRQIEGRDSWIYTLNVPGIVTIRFSIEVKNGYLVLSNIPWSQSLTVKAVERRDLNGAAAQLAPGAVKLGLPGLFATQSEQNQSAAVKSMAALYPLLLTLSATPEDAAARNAALFGSRPLHPGPGTWIWKNRKIQSSAYGSATQWKAPIYKADMGDFGLFEGVTHVSLNMQLETGGLRAVVRWMWKGGESRRGARPGRD